MLLCLISMIFSCTFSVEFQCLVLNSLFRRGQFIDASLFHFILVEIWQQRNCGASYHGRLCSSLALEIWQILKDYDWRIRELNVVWCCLMLFVFAFTLFGQVLVLSRACCTWLPFCEWIEASSNRSFFSSYFHLTGWHPTSPRREMALAGKGHARPHSSTSVRSQFGNLFTKFISHLSKFPQESQKTKSIETLDMWRHVTSFTSCRCWLHGGRGRGRL